VLDEFRQAAAGQPDRRSAEGECLDYRRPSWLFPLQRKQGNPRGRHQRVPLLTGHGADPPHPDAVNKGAHLVLPVADIRVGGRRTACRGQVRWLPVWSDRAGQHQVETAFAGKPGG
jgi:hypothetical protein